jgi:putative ABC transport system permease protein
MLFTPPRLAEALLRCALTAEDAEVISGDLEETARMSIAPREGCRAARRWYRRQVISIVLTRMLNPAADPADVHHPKRLTMAALRQDVFYGVRSLRKQPAFTAMAIVMLALGIGATVAIFSLANAVMLKPLPFADPDRLMLVHLLAPEERGVDAGPMIWSFPKYRVFRDNQRSFESSATFAAWNWNITGSGSPERADGELVEGSYFNVLGLAPLVGRAFSEEETRAAGSPPLVVLSHRVWMTRFGADTQVPGRSMGLNGIPHTIIGVMPAGFRGLTGRADLWVPVTTLSAADLEEKWNHSYYVVARRKAEIAPAQAEADVRVLGDLIHAQIGAPGDRPEAPWSATAVPLNEERVDPLIRRSIVLLLGAVLSVLLIICINLANLTLARGLVRQRDVAIRLALGASRSRIVSQFMTESVLLAAAGAVAAIGVAYALLSAGAALMPDLRAVLPRGGAASGLTRVGLGRLGVDAATLLFTLFASAGAATMFGLIPAWRASRRDLTGTIKVGAAAATGQGIGLFSGRNLLIVAETALALVLLTVGGLMLKSAVRLQATDLGFSPASVLSVRLVLPGPQYNGERATQFLEQLVGRLAARGDLQGAAYGSCAPVQGGCNGTTATFPDRPSVPGAPKSPVGVLWASPAYFDTLGIRVVRGRVFTDHDRAGQPKVVVVNDTAARVLWPGEDPIGKRIALGQGRFEDGAEVVGIVADVRYGRVDRPVGPDVYLPLLQSRRAFGVIFVKSRASTASVVAAVRSDVHALDPDLPLTDIRMMDERVSEATWGPRTSAWLLGAFAMLALLLVALGVYAVVSQGVQQRTREIGVRLAMGASTRDILRLIIGRVFAIAAAGILLGVALAIPAAKLLTALLYQVRPRDPWVFAPLALVLLTVAVAAGYIPARRATRVDPLVTLRAE